MLGRAWRLVKTSRRNIASTRPRSFWRSMPTSCPMALRSVRYAHDFATRRRVREGQTAMNRLYVVESTPSMTGAMADHRLPMRAR